MHTTNNNNRSVNSLSFFPSICSYTCVKKMNSYAYVEKEGKEEEEEEI